MISPRDARLTSPPPQGGGFAEDKMLLNGDKLYMIPASSTLQCMGFLLAGEGDVIGIDACTEFETETLERTVLALGGTVQCWFLTHAHFDHIEGLTGLLARNRVKVERICYLFPPVSFVEQEERGLPRTTHINELESLIRERRVPVVRPVKGKRMQVGHFRVTPLSDGVPAGDVNSSSIVYRVETKGAPVLFLGDMNERAEQTLLGEFPEELKCPVVQMAHHGQNGVSEAFYRHIHPKVCLWPTPEWLWNNDAGGGYGTGPFTTLSTRAWMEALGTTNYRFEKDVTVLE